MTMTEIEARGKIKYRIANEMRNAGENKEEYEDLEIALQVMKEIREYRELGTVEELKFLVENVGSIKLLKEYSAIGTVEELKALKEKNEPKKPYLDQKGLLDVKMWHCSVCNKEVISDWNRDLANDYCHHCGQKLDWE